MKARDPQDCDRLLRLLHSREISPEVEKAFYALKKEGYNFLLKSLNRTDLTDRQSVNVLLMLQKLRVHGDEDEFFERLLSLSKDPRIAIRSTAISIAISLAHYGIRKTSPDEILPAAKKALSLGLAKNAETLVRNYLAAREH